jgi:mRNA interferase HicA
VKGKEFVDRVFELGADRHVSARLDTKRGKGSHITLYYGTRKTIVKDRRKEIAPGLLHAMIRQLGLERDDFR